MGLVAFETDIVKTVDIQKTVELDVDKSVLAAVDVDGKLATAEASADATGTASGLGTIVWGVQPDTGDILLIDPTTGAQLDSFAAPGNLSSDDTGIGLSIAEGGSSSPNTSVLIYQNDDDPVNSNTLYRIDPFNGLVLTVETGDPFPVEGLSYETGPGDDDFVYTVHDGVDMHRTVAYDGNNPTFFWGPGDPLGGAGGDDNGRLFAYYTDGFIHEVDPFVDQPFFISTLPSPTDDVQGLAFDSVNLYVSDSDGTLWTLDPDNGDVLNEVQVAGGGLYGLGALQVEIQQGFLAETDTFAQVEEFGAFAFSESLAASSEMLLV